MAEQKVRVCDVCGKQDAEQYTIIDGIGPVKVDLCAEHAAPIIEVVAKGQRQQKRQRRRTVKTDRIPKKD